STVTTVWAPDGCLLVPRPRCPRTDGQRRRPCTCRCPAGVGARSALPIERAGSLKGSHHRRSQGSFSFPEKLSTSIKSVGSRLRQLREAVGGDIREAAPAGAASIRATDHGYHAE